MTNQGQYQKEKIESKIFERDRYRCSGWSRMHVRSLNIHYIDGNIENNDPLNLISLCGTCYRLVLYMKEGKGRIQSDFKALERLFLVIAKHRTKRKMSLNQIQSIKTPEI